MESFRRIVIQAFDALTSSLKVTLTGSNRVQVFNTTAALGANALYTSTSLDGIHYRRLTGKVYADQAGTLAIQHSDDDTTWDTLTSIIVTAATPAKFDEPIYARYVRVVYTNSVVPQTVFRLSGLLSAE